MSLPLEKLLDRNENRYELCTAAIKIAERLESSFTSEEIAQEKEKIAILSIGRLLDGDVGINETINRIEKRIKEED